MVGSNGMALLMLCCVAEQVVHQFFMQFTGLSLETVQEETDRDNFLSPQRAIELGLIDAVL